MGPDARSVLLNVGDDSLSWATAICSVAHEEGADLIVIGQRHRGWLDRLFTRSVTNDVLRNANCPVLVVP